MLAPRTPHSADQAPPRLAFWQKLLSPRTVSIVDVGAMPAAENYHVLMHHGMAEVVAFEPNPEGCSQLNGLSLQLRCYPWVIGDGGTRSFHLNAMPHTSSIYPSNLELLANFGYHGPFTTLEIRELQTRRLDTLGEIRDCDLLKLDVQGAELDVLRGAEGLLDQVMLVETELCFLPFYHGQPLFGDIDRALREQGFMLHRFVGDNAVRASWFREAVPDHLNQLLWTDAIYLRDPGRLEGYPPEKLLSMALILDVCYRSVDAAARVLQHYDRRTGTRLLPEFLQGVTQNP